MDILFFLTGCLGLAETIDLFCGKDFLIFISDSIDPKKYNLKKVYAVEKWLFAIDTLSLFGMAFHLGGGTGDLVLAAIVIVVLFVQNIGKAAARRRSEKEVARAEDARRKELEEAKSAAFASGQAAAASAQPDPQEKTEEKPE